jgi:predicted transcriptional regulator
MIWLTTYDIGCKLGLVNNASLSKDELQTKLGKSGKIVSTRLAELVKNGIVQKNADEKFKITTFGVVQTQKEVLPRIKTKING